MADESVGSSGGKSGASPSKGGGGGGHVFQAPTGTRDFYPAELNRLRYVQKAWRTTSINHGFEEIDGPTFEHLDLYTVKSGEGIVSELFSFERFGGEKTFALRPEFTPTLARMYASKASSLPKPTKWFWMQNCYRAERPQRGRLREFCQWNCDIIGGEVSYQEDAEVIACCVGMMRSLGLTSKDVRVKISSRWVIQGAIERAAGGGEVDVVAALRALDSRSKVSPADFSTQLATAGVQADELDRELANIHKRLDEAAEGKGLTEEGQTPAPILQPLMPVLALFEELGKAGIDDWCDLDFSIARGLAYYTGMVFEVHEASGAERAIAGGGRYDKLIEMFGGPPTPAVGFGMGDVVLSLVLQDKGLLPKDEEMGAKLGLNPDALVISNGSAEADGAVAGVVAELRRSGLHARRSYKTTKNIGKLIQDAAKIRARYCVILEGAEKATVKDMGTQGQEGCGVGELVERIRR